MMVLRNAPAGAALVPRGLPSVRGRVCGPGDPRHDGLATEPLDDAACWLHGKAISDFPKSKSTILSENRNCALSVFQKALGMDIKRIKAALKRPDKSNTALAAKLKVPNSAITAILNGARQIKDYEVPIITEYLEFDHVPIMGEIGTGAVIEPEYEQVPPDGLSTIRLPFSISDELIAFEVHGDSMLPKYNAGDVVVVYRNMTRGIESFYGEEAAVRTQEGRRYLKTIRHGTRKGRVSLDSSNAKPIENVKVVWIGEIFATLPSRRIKRISQREHKRSQP